MKTMGELLDCNAAEYPHKEAIIFDELRITYSQLQDRVRRLSSGLYELGLRRQDRVSILATNCIEYFDLFAAGDYAGYMVSTVNFRLAAPEIGYILSDAAPKILIFEAQYAAVIDSLRSRLPGIQHYICLGEAPPWAMRYADMIAMGQPEGPPIRSKPDDYGYLIYTSGTTGRPKGTYRRQERWLRSAESGACMAEFTSDTRALLTSPAFHLGAVGYVNSAYYRGATSVIHRSYDPVKALETIEKEKITFTFMVAAMLQAFLDVPGVEKRDLSSMRGIVTAAAPVPVPLLQRAIKLLGPIFFQQFGSTEAGNITVMYRDEVRPHGTPDDIRRLASTGHAGRQVEMRVVNDDGMDCAVGETGEVWMKSGAMFNGYWNNTPATIESLMDGWFRTGDMGYLDNEGYLFLVDRKKDMIISGGENIYSREVEIAVIEHPDVADVAVIGVADPKWGEAVKAVAVLKPDARVTEEQLIAHCKQRIASYKCPKHVEFIAELPRIATGKIDKVALRNREKSRSAG